MFNCINKSAGLNLPKLAKLIITPLITYNF